MIEELQEKIGIIRDYYTDNNRVTLTPEATQRLKNVERNIAEIQLKSNITDNPLMAELKEQLKEKVASTENALRDQKVKNDEHIIERGVLFAQLDWYKKELNMFIDSKKSFEQIDKQLDSWISKLK